MAKIHRVILSLVHVVCVCMYICRYYSSWLFGSCSGSTASPGSVARYWYIIYYIYGECDWYFIYILENLLGSWWLDSCIGNVGRCMDNTRQTEAITNEDNIDFFLLLLFDNKNSRKVRTQRTQLNNIYKTTLQDTTDTLAHQNKKYTTKKKTM